MRFSPTNGLDGIYLAPSFPEIQLQYDSWINLVYECVQTVLLDLIKDYNYIYSDTNPLKVFVFPCLL